MALAVVFDHFTGGRNEFQFPADIFLADQDHLRTTYRTDLISSVCSAIIVFSCDTVSFSSRSWISFALEAIVSLLGFDSFIIPERGLLLKENNA